MRIITGFLALASLAGSLAGAAAGDHRSAIAATGQVPLSFERTTSGNAHWMARGNGYQLALDATDVEVGLKNEQLHIRFAGGDAKAQSTGLDALPGKVNYFVGRDPNAWLRDVPTYGRVRYKGVYPGVDVVWYGKQGRLEYDLDLQPGADPNKIAMRFEGARKLTVDANGDLRVEMASGSLSLKLPEVYQEGSGGRKRIESGYELRASNEVGFRLAAYDKTRALVIDPTLVYATFFASGSTNGGGPPVVDAVAVDASGNIYIGGYTTSSFIPALNAVQAGNVGLSDAFIAKFDPTGTTLLYSTYLGGSQSEYLQGIAVDPTTGELVGVGQTSSPDFPLVNAVLCTLPPGDQGIFAFRLTAAGNQLVYSTYLGGTSFNYSSAIGLDATGNAYFTGHANSAVTSSGALNNCCTLVEKLSPTGGQVYLARIGADVGNAIAVDTTGAAYVAGTSTASSFPNNPPGAHTTNAGGGDAFIAKLSPDATSLVWATFLGGSGSDSATAIALGTGNVVYVGGQAASADLPVTTGVVQGTYGGGTDAFVASLSADGSSFGFVTYLGGGKPDSLVSLSVGSGGLIVAGNTSSRDFPIANAVQPAFPDSPYCLLKSTNSGASFTPADTGLNLTFPNSICGAILPDPSNAGTLVLDTEQGVFRSTDDGATWVSVQPNTTGVGSTARSLSNPSVLYSVSYGNVSKSTDGGQTWSTPGVLPPWANAVAISPTDPSIVLLFEYGSQYRSTNGGQTYSYSGVPFSIYNGESEIVASPDGSMYAVSGYEGLWKSLDGGVIWNMLGTGVLPSYLPGFALSLSNPSVLYGSDGSHVYKSTNAGTSWSTVATGTTVIHLAVDPSNPQTVYGTSAANDAVLASTDGGATWTPTSGPLDLSNITGFSVNPSNSAELYVSNYVSNSGFVTKLSTDGKTLLWSTYYGPYGVTYLGGAVPSPAGAVWMAGYVWAGSLPLTPDARNGNTNALAPAFLARISDATATCGYTISPATQYSYSAGRLAFSVTAPSGCPWTATPSDGWIHLIRTSGTGSGTIPLAVDANTTASTRNGTVTVNDQIYTIVQPSGVCSYQVKSPALTSAGGTASITVTAPAGCPWDVELQNSDPAALTSPSTGTGNGMVTISIPPNAGVNSPLYDVQIGGSLSIISQASGCAFSFPNGAAITIPADIFQSSVQVNASLNACQVDPSGDQGWLLVGPTYGNSVDYGAFLNNTGSDRTGHIVVGAQQFTVTQRFTSAEFADVPPSATYFDAANLMFLAGVTTGCVAGSTPQTRSYCPNDNVTREEMAAFIVRAVTGTTTPAIYNPVPYFTDVPTTNLFFPHIQKMEELGITAGCATGLFCPEDNVPRWQMAIFMVRARLALYGAAFTTATTPYFADVPTNVEGNGIPFPFIQRSYEENITAGCGGNPLNYCPDDLVTRGEMASFIMRGLFNETMAVGPTAPLLTGVSPNTMAAMVGAQMTVTITGVNTNFQSGDTVAVPSGMLAVSNVVVNSATSISVVLTANANVVDGPQALVVTTGGQNLTLPLAIKVGTY